MSKLQLFSITWMLFRSDLGWFELNSSKVNPYLLPIENILLSYSLATYRKVCDFRSNQPKLLEQKFHLGFRSIRVKKNYAWVKGCCTSFGNPVLCLKELQKYAEIAIIFHLLECRMGRVKLYSRKVILYSNLLHCYNTCGCECNYSEIFGLVLVDYFLRFCLQNRAI